MRSLVQLGIVAALGCGSASPSTEPSAAPPSTSASTVSEGPPSGDPGEFCGATSVCVTIPREGGAHLSLRVQNGGVGGCVFDRPWACTDSVFLAMDDGERIELARLVEEVQRSPACSTHEGRESQLRIDGVTRTAALPDTCASARLAAWLERIFLVDGYP